MASTKKTNLPSREQLISVIANGDDRKNNSVIFNSEGLFELIDCDFFDISQEYPNIVMRYETFTAGNDFVGIEAANDNRLIKDIYTQSLEYWLIYLLTNKTHFYADGSIPPRDVSEIVAEIEALE
jgi:hypothetical protein